MNYQPYLPHDKAFMEREGEPCRNCLRPFTDHHNGKCPEEKCLAVHSDIDLHCRMLAATPTRKGN